MNLPHLFLKTQPCHKHSSSSSYKIEFCNLLIPATSTETQIELCNLLPHPLNLCFGSLAINISRPARTKTYGVLLLWAGKIDLPHDAAILAIVGLPDVRLLLAIMYSNLLDPMLGLSLRAHRIELEASIAGLAVPLIVARLFCPRELGHVPVFPGAWRNPAAGPSSFVPRTFKDPPAWASP